MDKEFYKIKTDETSASITNSEIDSVRNRKKERSSARVFDNGFIGISSSMSFSEREILEKKAIDSLSLNIPVQFSLPSGTKRTWDVSGEVITEETLLKATDELLQKLSKRNPDFIFSGLCRTSRTEEHLENTLGADYTVRASNMLLEIMFKHKNSASIIDGAFANVYYDYPDIDEFVQKFSSHLDAFGNLIVIEDESIPVIFWQDPTIMSFFAKHLNGELLELNSSYFSSKIDKQIFSEKFSLYDINYDPEQRIANPFDGDGFVREKHILPLIEEGRVKSGMYDLRRAAMYKKEPTGTSSRPYNQSSVIYPNYLYAKETGVSLKDLKRALFVLITSGGDFQDDGSISLPVQLGYLYEDGFLKGRVQELMLNNTIEKMFGMEYIGTLKETMFRNGFEKYLALRMNIQKG
ncbi:MAG: metallopeptidase TldD-related protein [bacterium]